MTQNGHNWRLFSLLSAGNSLRLASLKTGMNAKTARKYRKTGQCRAICQHTAIVRRESDTRPVIRLIVSRSVDREACISACRAPAVIRSIEAPVAGNTQLQAFLAIVSPHRETFAVPPMTKSFRFSLNWLPESSEIALRTRHEFCRDVPKRCPSWCLAGYNPVRN